MKSILDLFKSKDFGKDLDNRLNDINQDEEVEKLLGEKIESDIQQYIGEKGGFTGDDRVTVIVDKDRAYVAWNAHWMPTIEFYRFVTRNGGYVKKEDFKNY